MKLVWSSSTTAYEELAMGPTTNEEDGGGESHQICDLVLCVKK
jgi:hypothetical protein